MLHYTPTQEPDSERLLLLDFEHPMYGSEYGHLTARVIRRAEKDYEKDGRTVYKDGKDATGYRHATWLSAKDKALYVEDFRVTAQFDLKTYKDASKSPAYGEDIEFAGLSMRVRSDEAARMHDTFTKVARKMAKQVETYGNPIGFYALAIRVAVALGITKFARYPEVGKNANRSLDQRLQEFKLNDVEWVANQLIDKARAEYA